MMRQRELVRHRRCRDLSDLQSAVSQMSSAPRQPDFSFSFFVVFLLPLVTDRVVSHKLAKNKSEIFTLEIANIIKCNLHI